jgi:ketosteroid isomerase-like protein
MHCCHVHQVRILGGGNVAVISYVRLQQSHDAATGLKLGAVQETRVWEKQAGGSWKCVHLHRSTEAK